MVKYQKRQIVAGSEEIGTVGIIGDVEVVQPIAADLKATVTQHEKDRTVTGTVNAEQGIAASLKATVTQESNLREMKGSPDGGSTWVPIKVDANGQLCTV